MPEVDKVLRIRFQGKEWIFVGDRLARGGPIATEEAYQKGEASYAHLLRDGRIQRFNEVIGTIDDVEVLGATEVEIPDPLGSMANMATHPSWREGGLAPEEQKAVIKESIKDAIRQVNDSSGERDKR